MNKDPYLQYRHCEGLGDIIACTLHSKPLSPITKVLTGKDAMCHACDKRRKILNLLFPLNIWKMFFKNEEQKLKDLEKYFVISEKKEETEYIENKNIIFNNFQPSLDAKEGYSLLNKSEIEVDNYIYKTIIYKKI